MTILKKTCCVLRAATEKQQRCWQQAGGSRSFKSGSKHRAGREAEKMLFISMELKSMHQR